MPITNNKIVKFTEVECENCGSMETIMLDQNYNILIQDLDCSHCGLTIKHVGPNKNQDGENK